MWRSTFVPETIFRRSLRLKQTDRRFWTIQTHSDELNWARSRTFHELNWLSLVLLMKSSSFGLGVIEADVQLFMNVTYYKFGSSHENFVVGLDLSHDKPIVHSGFNSAGKIIYHRTFSNVSSIKQETVALKNPWFFFALIENSRTLFYRKSEHTFMACETNIHWKNTLMICLIQKQLDFVESIFSNVVLTDGTGSFCNGVLHSLFNHRNGSISVVWTLWWSKTVTT